MVKMVRKVETKKIFVKDVLSPQISHCKLAATATAKYQNCVEWNQTT